MYKGFRYMDKSNAKNINKKILISALALLLIMLTSCRKNYPIVAYDHDLTDEDRRAIIKLYEEELAYNESLKRKNAENEENEESGAQLRDNVSAHELDTFVDDNYIEYEDRNNNGDTSLSNASSNSNPNNANNNSNDASVNDFPVVVLFKNQPDFDLTLYKSESFENYSDLDSLGRVGKAEAMLGKETMPSNGRESIGMIKPTGWHTIKYDNIDGNYLYNRCHLIGWQLSAENKNEKNLFTGTRYLNVKGMLPYENQVANYIKTTGNHVLYRVTPYYSGNNLLVSHVQIEAMSYEDKGAGICFNVKLDNIQPGIHINYADGSSYQEVEVSS
jgi:hypothetical protein